MGLDASVMCACYREGKTTPCPFPEAFVIDEDGFPALKEEALASDEELDAFDRWLATCCPHANMDHTVVFVGTRPLYEAFLQALDEIGAAVFPTLKAELPEGNQGKTDAHASEKALLELNHFRQRQGDVKRPCLINSETGEVVVGDDPENAEHLGRGSLSGLKFGLDERGFVVVDSWELDRELFRSTRFRQDIIEPADLDQLRQFVLTDEESGRRFVSSVPVRLYEREDLGLLTQVFPRYLHVEPRGMDGRRFSRLLEALTMVFRASVETGNPVRWS